MVVELGMEANHKEVKMKPLFRLTLSTWFKTSGSLMPGGWFIVSIFSTQYNLGNISWYNSILDVQGSIIKLKLNSRYMSFLLRK